MSQTDLYQIPTAAFMEHFVFEEALKLNCSLRQASEIICKRFGVRDTLVFPLNETRLLSLLYSLLVFPSEIWKRDELLDVVLERMQTDTEQLSSNNENVNRNVIRSMRNAAAHARISFDDSYVTFEDQRGEAPPHFELKLSYAEAANFLLVLGRAFHESAQVKAFVAKTGRKNQ